MAVIFGLSGSDFGGIIGDMTHPKEELTLVIVKPDALQRNLLGEIIHRFERKGLRVVGTKMMKLSDIILKEHYVHHADKPFFAGLKNFMQSAPVVVLALAGMNAINATRIIVGPTKGHEAPAGTIRGDMGLSGQANLVHASDGPETAAEEIKRFFDEDELQDYKKIDFDFIYGEEEREE